MTQLRHGPRPLPAWRLAMWSAVAALLLAPLVAMQFTDSVAWTASDFAVAAALLIGAALVYELASRLTSRPAWRLAIGAAILTAVALIWAQGAVGIL